MPATSRVSPAVAAVDITYAVVRRGLRTGEPMSRRAPALVEDSARALLG